MSSKWEYFTPFYIYIAQEPIDKYVAYRLIPPDYELWNKMGIYQRNLENFEESAIYENTIGDYNLRYKYITDGKENYLERVVSVYDDIDPEILVDGDIVQVFLAGRHHQIRCQLAHIGCPIRGDLKYGYPRSNPDASISLHAWRIAFEHPVSKTQIEVKAPLPKVSPWTAFEQMTP